MSCWGDEGHISAVLCRRGRCRSSLKVGAKEASQRKRNFGVYLCGDSILVISKEIVFKRGHATPFIQNPNSGGWVFESHRLQAYNV